MHRAHRLVVAALLIALAPLVAADDVVRGKQSVIIAGHPEATRLGLEVLKRGGTAADALVTVSFALGLTEPGNSGPGGKLVMLYYDAKKGEVTFVAALGEAPAKINVAKVVGMTTAQRKRGWHAALIPGQTAALAEAHRRWGTMPWRDLVTPVAQLAAEGFEVSPLCARMLEEFPANQADAEARRVYTPNGKTPAAGSVHRNPDLAHTYQMIAEGGADAFYKGEIAKKLVAASQAGGGWMTLEDFANYKPRVLQPLAINYGAFRVYSSPPPLIGGSIMLASMQCLAINGWHRATPRDANYIDTTGRILQQVYSTVGNRIGDVPDANQRIAKIMEPDNIRKLAAAALAARVQDPFAGKRASLDVQTDDDVQGSTTHLIIVDANHNIACVTQSLSNHFGAAVIAPGTGFLLNNEVTNFAFLTPTSVNYLAGGKWPRSTMTPTIVMKDNKPVLAIGSPAAQRIPVQVMQVLLDVIDFNRPLDQAVKAPRFHVVRPTTKGEPANVVDLEYGSAPRLADELSARGWQSKLRKDDDFYFGSVNGAIFMPDGTVTGVADQRRTNDAGGG